MQPTKSGQIVRFHTPFPDENPNDRFVVTEIHHYDDETLATIQQLGAGVFGHSGDYPVKDLEVAGIGTTDLTGTKQTVVTSDGTYKGGFVTDVSEKEVKLEMEVTKNGVVTNVIITVKNDLGEEYTGRLYVIPRRWNFII